MALHSACASGNLRKVKALLKEDPTCVNVLDAAGCTPLVRACEGCHTATVKFLMAQNADVDLACPDGRTPGSVSSVAAQRGDPSARSILRLLGDKGRLTRHTPATNSVRWKYGLITLCISLSCYFLFKARKASDGLVWMPPD
eukprot:EG_transcript_33252